MKKCGRCKALLPKDLFGSNKSRKDGLQSHCKECRKQISKNWYHNKTVGQKENHKQSVKINKQRKKDFIDNFKSKIGCIDCGEKDPVVLDFDHLQEKSFNIGDSNTRSLSLHKIMQEIEKCEVRCSNCHRKMTAKRRIDAAE